MYFRKQQLYSKTGNKYYDLFIERYIRANFSRGARALQPMLQYQALSILFGRETFPK